MKRKYLLILIVLGLAWAVYYNQTSSEVAYTQAKEESPQETLERIIAKHPDADVAFNLYQLWKSDEVWVHVEDLPYNGASAMFDLADPERAAEHYGRASSKAVQPVIRIGAKLLKKAGKDPAAFRRLTKSVRHEFAHYLQWESGTHFRVTRESPLPVWCQEIWNREYPVHLEDCDRMQEWWPSNPWLGAGALATESCKVQNNEAAFAQVLFTHLSEVMPQCIDTWKGMLE